MPKLNGGQVIARILKAYGVPYAAGIPGHGIWGLMDAFNEDESKIPFIQTYPTRCWALPPRTATRRACW
jgi:acetolactate synthase-1/2/3 large subunit